jgi:hypothetical protein
LPRQPAGSRHQPDQYARLAQALAIFGKRLKPICDGLVKRISGSADRGPHLQQILLDQHDRLQLSPGILGLAEKGDEYNKHDHLSLLMSDSSRPQAQPAERFEVSVFLSRDPARAIGNSGSHETLHSAAASIE